MDFYLAGGGPFSGPEASVNRHSGSALLRALSHPSPKTNLDLITRIHAAAKSSVSDAELDAGHLCLC